MNAPYLNKNPQIRKRFSEEISGIGRGDFGAGLGHVLTSAIRNQKLLLLRLRRRRFNGLRIALNMLRCGGRGGRRSGSDGRLLRFVCHYDYFLNERPKSISRYSSNMGMKCRNSSDCSINHSRCLHGNRKHSVLFNPSNQVFGLSCSLPVLGAHQDTPQTRMFLYHRCDARAV